jgi:hypothetical protein
MKPLMPAALLIALSAVALAKPTPIELPTALVDAGVMNMRTGLCKKTRVRLGLCASENTLKRRNHR